ncbi:MAG: septum formation inhibitor Maf [Nitrospina sp.]|jgi:septum formation protein|nr:septum formation inhibitor Maf [Nitrospina sp.]MBT3509059.1 septum formation inhibitor Maf [Nitrospina sp.]MBT3876759.1 septum formation inhibitor Maf [Nitrospina sp.]MBT4047886.1 septum formation inhibitor Maf [Nitrospina sp.]MBT4558553.1 septum formation inhibitor Maf [Nitrospina sp.]
MTENTPKLILASQSPRRLELLQQITDQFEVVPSSVEEKLDYGLRPEENVRLLARAKAENVAKNYPECWVIGADTLVALHQEILGKPVDVSDAHRILSRLSGKEHRVMTGVCVVSPKKTLDTAVTSNVRFKSLTDEEISNYIQTGEPMDKAGAYAIQGKGNFMIREFSGSKSNIIGLPIDELKTLLAKTGFPPTSVNG